MPEAASAERPRTKAKPPAPPVDQPVEAPNRIAELQVTAHLMSLEAGLFCVFQTPGSLPPDDITGLPGVRITPAPGIAGSPETVSVSTFREDGWLNGTAALVRVTNGAAQILVTIYQQKGQDAAPRLQVLRLSAEPTGAVSQLVASAVGVPTQATAATAVETKAAPNPEVMAHVQRSGDVTCMIGDWLGLKGSRQWVEGFGLAPANGIALHDIEYQGVLGRNWLSPWVEGGKFCGSRGMALPLLGLKVRLKGAAAKAFECSYAATFVDGSEIGPVSSGEACAAGSLAALEAFQVIILPRRDKANLAKAPLGKVAAKRSADAKPTAPKTMAGPAPVVSRAAVKPGAKA